MNKLGTVLSGLTPGEREKLAKRVGTSVEVLRSYANGRRSASAARAIAIEKAAARLGHDVPRGSLCEACRTCEYARACLKKEGK